MKCMGHLLYVCLLMSATACFKNSGNGTGAADYPENISEPEHNEVRYMVSVYPNPAGDYITVDGIPPESELLIVGLTGKIMFREITRGPTETVDISGYPNGLYRVITITNNKREEFRRILKW